MATPLSNLLHRTLRRTYITGTDRCWLWVGPTNGGYGQLWYTTDSGTPTTTTTHRVMYLSFVGPIPDGFQVHHTCEVRRCVNPAHLQAISRQDHGSLHAAEHLERNPCCVRCGSDQWEYRGSSPVRKCVPCQRRIHREWLARKKEEKIRERGIV